MSELDEQKIFELLSHNTRRKLLKTLSQESYLSYSELQKFLDQSPGVIYHHLEKLVELKFIQQRETKEYELTQKGMKLVEYLHKVNDDDLDVGFKPSKLKDFFTYLPLVELIQNNPLHWFVEMGLFSLILFFVLIDFPVLIIGPFLIPKLESVEIRIFFIIISLLLIFLLIEFLKIIYSKSSKIDFDIVLVNILMTFLATSLLASTVLWMINNIFSEVPIEIYWLITIVVHVFYYYFIIQFSIKIKKFSVEYSVITSLIIGYCFLIFTFLVT